MRHHPACRCMRPWASRRAFTGSGRLPQRPLSVYPGAVAAARCNAPDRTGRPGRGTACLRLSGRLTGGEYCLPGDISSQFVSGLLLALPLCREDSVIRLTSPLESAGYVRMTLEAMRRGVFQVETEKDGWRIPGQVYGPSAIRWKGLVPSGLPFGGGDCGR